MNKKLLFLLAAPAVSLAAHALDWAPDGVFASGGLAPSASRNLTVGLQWSGDWQRRFGNTEATGFTEVFVTRWSAQGVVDRDSITQVGVLPMVRLRLNHGHSPWFMEGGIGASLTNKLYRNHDKQFSTRFNFVDVFGIGRSLDAQQRHEVSLRLAHMSNASIKRPNPGENFLQLRYAVAF